MLRRGGLEEHDCVGGRVGGKWGGGGGQRGAPVCCVCVAPEQTWWPEVPSHPSHAAQGPSGPGCPAKWPQGATSGVQCTASPRASTTQSKGMTAQETLRAQNYLEDTHAAAGGGCIIASRVRECARSRQLALLCLTTHPNGVVEQVVLINEGSTRVQTG